MGSHRLGDDADVLYYVSTHIFSHEKKELESDRIAQVYSVH